jgi:hypothetical protein
MNPFFESMIKTASAFDLLATGAKKVGRAAVTGTGKALEVGADVAHKALYVPNGKGGSRLSLTRAAGVGAAGYLGVRAIKANSDYQGKLSRNYGENRHPTGMNPTFGAGK